VASQACKDARIGRLYSIPWKDRLDLERIRIENIGQGL
jgi:hypothetical protein